MRTKYLWTMLMLSAVPMLAGPTSDCGGAIGSGCGQWWTSYAIGGTADGSWNQNAGSANFYTANYTNIAATQSPLQSTFSWSSANNSSFSTNNWNDFEAMPYSSWTSGLGSSSSVTTANVASNVPTYTSGSASGFVDNSGFNSSYLSMLSLMYGGGTPVVVVNSNNNNRFSVAADAPEPGTLITLGLGLGLLAAYRMRKKR